MRRSPLRELLSPDVQEHAFAQADGRECRPRKSWVEEARAIMPVSASTRATNQSALSALLGSSTESRSWSVLPLPKSSGRQDSSDEPVRRSFSPTGNRLHRRNRDQAKCGRLWQYSNTQRVPIGVRTAPRMVAAKTGHTIFPGEVFCVDQELESEDDVVFLRLANNSGWLFDRKPGVGILCEPYSGLVAADLNSDIVQFASPLHRSDIDLSSTKASGHQPCPGADLKQSEISWSADSDFAERVSAVHETLKRISFPSHHLEDDCSDGEAVSAADPMPEEVIAGSVVQKRSNEHYVLAIETELENANANLSAMRAEAVAWKAREGDFTSELATVSSELLCHRRSMQRLEIEHGDCKLTLENANELEQECKQKMKSKETSLWLDAEVSAEKRALAEWGTQVGVLKAEITTLRGSLEHSVDTPESTNEIVVLRARLAKEMQEAKCESSLAQARFLNSRQIEERLTIECAESRHLREYSDELEAKLRDESRRLKLHRGEQRCQDELNEQRAECRELRENAFTQVSLAEARSLKFHRGEERFKDELKEERAESWQMRDNFFAQASLSEARSLKIHRGEERLKDELNEERAETQQLRENSFAQASRAEARYLNFNRMEQVFQEELKEQCEKTAREEAWHLNFSQMEGRVKEELKQEHAESRQLRKNSELHCAELDDMLVLSRTALAQAKGVAEAESEELARISGERQKLAQDLVATRGLAHEAAVALENVESESQDIFDMFAASDPVLFTCRPGSTKQAVGELVDRVKDLRDEASAKTKNVADHECELNTMQQACQNAQKKSTDLALKMASVATKITSEETIAKNAVDRQKQMRLAFSEEKIFAESKLAATEFALTQAWASESEAKATVGRFSEEFATLRCEVEILQNKVAREECGTKEAMQIATDHPVGKNLATVAGEHTVATALLSDDENNPRSCEGSELEGLRSHSSDLRHRPSPVPLPWPRSPRSSPVSPMFGHTSYSDHERQVSRNAEHHQTSGYAARHLATLGFRGEVDGPASEPMDVGWRKARQRSLG